MDEHRLILRLGFGDRGIDYFLRRVGRAFLRKRQSGPENQNGRTEK